MKTNQRTTGHQKSPLFLLSEIANNSFSQREEDSMETIRDYLNRKVVFGNKFKRAKVAGLPNN